MNKSLQLTITCKSTRKNTGLFQEENRTLNNIFMLTLNTMNFDISTSREYDPE